MSALAWEFRDPLFLLAILLAPLVYFFAISLSSYLRYSSLELPNRAPSSLRVSLATAPAWLLALTTVSLAIALAGPRVGDQTTRIQREGIAMMMALDHSGSMNARDFVANDQSVSRLDALKQVFRSFVLGGEAGKGRVDDLIGVVVFGTYADSVCPLTLDHTNLLQILDQVEVAQERSESATAIGEGLGLAVERLLESQAHSRILILLTDGVNNAGEIAPLEAAELAARYGIKVYTIGAGRSGYAPVPVMGADGRQYLRRALVEMDEATLKAIAQKTGGRYFHAEDAKALADVYREIDQLERTKIAEIRYLTYRDYYPYFVLLALVLIGFASLISATVLRRLP